MFTRILVPLDGSKLSERVLPHVEQFARAFQSHVILLQVLDTNHDTEKVLLDPLTWQVRKAESDLYLQTIAQDLKQKGFTVEHHLREGRTAESIVQFAQENNIDLLAICSHGQGGLSRWNLSSVIHKVIEKVYLPVLIVRAYEPVHEDDQPLRYKRILVPFDCSQRAECAIPTAVALAQANDSVLVLTTILKKPDLPIPDVRQEELHELSTRFIELSREVVNTRLLEIRSRLPLDSQVRVLESDNITQALLELVAMESIDLVVFCAHGQGGQVAWPYGSVVSTYIEYGDQPVLVIQDMPPQLAHPTQAEIAAEKYGSRG